MKAIGYMRLSSRDQSKSLEYQESTIRYYCERNRLDLIELFKDNGEASDTFDRPDYLALERFLKKFKGDCDYLIVLDHDRFSRNLPEALMKIAELEKNFGVKVLSTNERIDLDTSDPDVFMKRAFDYMIANKELFTIRSRTRQGIRNAREQGRYLGRAPIGYKNIVDGSKKNLIEIDPKKSPMIKKIFHDYLLGVPPYVIYKNVKTMGFKLTGNSAIHKILQNSTYAGLIRIPAFKEMPEKFVKGNHDPIISENEYWIVQGMLANKRKTKIRTDEEFPLRGVLKCWCGKSMTAGWSKGKRQYYLYYRCLEHTNVNLPGEPLHDQFNKLIESLSFDQDQLWVLGKGTEAMMVQPLKNKKEKIIELTSELKRLNKKIEGLEDRFLSNQIEASTYQTWFKKLKAEKSELEAKLNPKSSPQMEDDNVFGVLSELKSLFNIYEKCNVFQKHTIVRGVFKDELYYFDGKFRTPYINQAFEGNILDINKKGLLEIEQPLDFSAKTPLSTPEGIRTPDPRFRKPLLYPTELPRPIF